jgi:uncharacterized repeat protein (TIGR01451 family)
MKAFWKIALIVLISLQSGSLWAGGGWQVNLDSVFPSAIVDGHRMVNTPNGDCIIANIPFEPVPSGINFIQFKSKNGEICCNGFKSIEANELLLLDIEEFEYLPLNNKYIIIYTADYRVYYQIIESFDPLIVQPRHILDEEPEGTSINSLYDFFITENDTSIEIGMIKTNAFSPPVAEFKRFIIPNINLDIISSRDSIILDNFDEYSFDLSNLIKIKEEYICVIQKYEDFEITDIGIIKFKSDLTWDTITMKTDEFSLVSYLKNGNILLTKYNLDSDTYLLEIYNSSLQQLFTIDSSLLSIWGYELWLERNDGVIINIGYDNSNGIQILQEVDINNQKIGKVEEWKFNSKNEFFHTEAFTQFQNGYAYFLAYSFTEEEGEEEVFLFRIDSTGSIFKYSIYGNVFGDLENDCLFNENVDFGMGNTVTADFEDNQLYASSDNFGNYRILHNDTGIVKVSARNPTNKPLWKKGSCNDTITIDLEGGKDVDSVNFSFTPAKLCAKLTVNGILQRIRSLAPVFYDMTYCNEGTILSDDAYIEVKIDPILTIESAYSNGNNFPYTDLGNNSYRFDIGKVGIYDCGSFTITLSQKPEAILGQTICIESHIYPDDVCTETRYDGAIIEANATCLGDSVRLQLKNRGKAMQGPKKYFVIEDQVIRLQNTYNLPSNGVLAEIFAADSGKTYRITAEQETNFPNELGDRFVTAAIEGCRPSQENQFTTGNILPFPNYDGAPYFSTACQVITGSFDPNAKDASPVGYGEEHFIEKNTDINYTIYFQNTGNDTAYKVVIVDTISPFLDINTITSFVSSHDYFFERTDSNVVRFVFDSIYLVDSFENEPLSHGFIKFNIQQVMDNALDTRINNSADIYFDRNLPIVTNTTFHTIGEEFIEIKLISSTFNTQFNVKSIKVFPNPFKEKTQIILDSDELENPSLMLINMQGQIVKVISSINKNTFNIEREDLSNGMYLFKIMEGDKEVGNGKIIVQ